MYDYGEGVDQDYATAFHWYTKAVQQGNSDAQLNLGNMYLHGKGVGIDYEKAYELYSKATKQDEPIALGNIGQIYEVGAGVQQNNIKAFAHYYLASRTDNEFSEAINRRLSALKSKMSSDEIVASEREAKKLMREYGLE
jgi:TPR repeat protein